MPSLSGTEVLHSQSKLDKFLSEAVPKLQSYIELIQDITSKTLIIQCIIQLRVIAVTMVAYVSSEVPVQANLRQARPTLETKKEALTLCECVAVFNRKLLNVVTKELKLEMTPKDKTSTLSRKIKKLTKLHSNVNDFTLLVDKIVAYYARKPMGLEVEELPAVDELIKAKSKLVALKKSLKHEELYGLFSRYHSDFTTNQTSILFATLGIMDESYGNFIFNMDENMKMHQTDLYFIEKLVKERTYEIEATEESAGQGKEALQENLQKLGFTQESSKTIANSIPDEFIDFQSAVFWALRYIRHAFQHHPLLTEHSRYIYQVEKTDSWFMEEIKREQDVKDEEDCDDHQQSFPVKIINIETTAGEDEVSKFLKEQENCPDIQLFYHGTNHLSAKSIIEEGITLSRGEDFQDFSSGDGFYISEKFENAKSWSRASLGEHSAIIVYKIQRQQWDEANGNDVTSSKREWEEIVRLCRGGYKNKALKKMLLKDYDYIRGPSFKNPKQVIQAKKKSVCNVDFVIDEDIQVCIRNEDFAEKFGALSNILCVIFS